MYTVRQILHLITPLVFSELIFIAILKNNLVLRNINQTHLFQQALGNLSCLNYLYKWGNIQGFYFGVSIFKKRFICSAFLNCIVTKNIKVWSSAMIPGFGWTVREICGRQGRREFFECKYRHVENSLTKSRAIDMSLTKLFLRILLFSTKIERNVRLQGIWYARLGP